MFNSRSHNIFPALLPWRDQTDFLKNFERKFTEGAEINHDEWMTDSQELIDESFGWRIVKTAMMEWNGETYYVLRIRGLGKIFPFSSIYPSDVPTDEHQAKSGYYAYRTWKECQEEYAAYVKGLHLDPNWKYYTGWKTSKTKNSGS